MVDHSPHNPKVEGSSPAAAAGSEYDTKEGTNVVVVLFSRTLKEYRDLMRSLESFLLQQPKKTRNKTFFNLLSGKCSSALRQVDFLMI